MSRHILQILLDTPTPTPCVGELGTRRKTGGVSEKVIQRQSTAMSVLCEPFLANVETRSLSSGAGPGSARFLMILIQLLSMPHPVLEVLAISEPITLMCFSKHDIPAAGGVLPVESLSGWEAIYQSVTR